MRDRREIESADLHGLERSQKEARIGLGRAAGIGGLVNARPAAPRVLCPNCERDVSGDPWSYDDPPRRCCLTCFHRWEDAAGLAKARAEKRTIHFGTSEIAAMKDAARGPVRKRPSLVQERRERAAAEKRKAKDRRKAKAQRKARRRR
jgi:hypothetical protein